VADMGKEAIAALAVLALLLCCAAPASASDVLARWSLDEAAGQRVSDAAHGNHGVLGFSPSTDAADPAWSTGHDGTSALSFDGAHYVTVDDTTALEPRHVAVDAWVRRSGSPGHWRYVLSKGSVDCDRSAYGLYSGWAGGMSFYVSSTGAYTLSPEVPAAIVWDGAWHRVVGSYDGQRVQLWIDGAQVGHGTPASVSIAYGVGSKGVYLGTYRGSCSLGFRGKIDDVRVWNGLPPQPDQPLPIVEPVPGTPTRVAVGGGADRGAADQPVTTRSSSGAKLRRCMRVSLSRRAVPLGKRTVVVATVRSGGRRMAGVRVVVTGVGVTASAKTNRKGNASVAVRARKVGRLTVHVRGQRASCPTQTVRAR
jgi:hypothetical protein